MGWRDSTSEEAQEDLDGLLDAALGFARQELDTHGEFFPYGAAVSVDGQVRMVAADPEDHERPASVELLEKCREGLRRDRESLRAVAIVSDVRLEGGGDAVRIELEHAEGASMAVFLPYSKKRFRKGIEYGNLEAAPAQPSVWG